jgi:hypothetical protein
VNGDVVTAQVRGRVEIRITGARQPVVSEATSVATLARDSSGWHLRTLP